MATALITEHPVSASSGRLVVNADDWGRERSVTDRALECWESGIVSATSGMVFMADSERAAGLARERGLDVGLHLNFTTPFTAPGCPSALLRRQAQVARYLGRHRLAQVVFHPGLTGAFRDVARAQIDEFRRLYDAEPGRIDGHHHMHLCANVLLQQLLPTGILVRRHFSFEPGEKSTLNILYRRLGDAWLIRRHRVVDFFFSLTPLEPARLERIVGLARRFVVEVEAHPVNPPEYRFLRSGTLAAITKPVAPGAAA